MEKLEGPLRDLVIQVARVAYAIETIARRAFHAPGGDPCRCCGSTLYNDGSMLARCPSCRTENPR